MTAGTITFDIGGISPARLNLVSSDALAPLPMPVSLEVQIEKFNKFMDGGAHERRSDVSLDLAAALAQGLDIGRETAAPVAVEAPRAIEAPVSRVALDPRVAETTVVRHETVDEPEAVVRHETADASQVSRLAPQDTRLASDVSRLAIASRPAPDSRPLPAADVPRVAEAPTAVEVPRAIETPVSRVALDPRVVEAPVAVEVPRVIETPVSRVALDPRVAETPVSTGEPPRPARLSPETVSFAERPRTAAIVAEKTVVEVQNPAMAVVSQSVALPAEEGASSHAAGQAALAASASAGEADIDGKLAARPVLNRIDAVRKPDVHVAVTGGQETDVVLQAANVIDAVQPAVDSAAIEKERQVSAASSRTAQIAETVDKVVEAIVEKISFAPSLVRGEGVVRIVLRPDVLDGSEISMAVKNGELGVTVSPATPEAARLASAALPGLETAIASHASAFRRVSVTLSGAKKGKINETV